MKAERGLAFVINHPYVDALACFREPITLLADLGWRVDLYTTLSPLHHVPNFCRENIRLVPIEMTRMGTVRMVWQLAAHRPKYRWIFSVPQWSLHYAGIASSLAGIPMACISDELVAEAELTTAEQKRWKDLERKAHHKCRFTIALSSERAEFIRKENRLAADHPIYVIPNSAPGPALRLRSHYYRDTLGIPADRRIVLHAGSWWWRLSFSELEEIAKSWPGDTALVFQGRVVDHARGHSTHPNLHFCPSILPSDLLDYAVSSADIGLALYDDRRVNDRLMGSASGKIALYMKNALPVITTSQPCFEWIEKEGCGICVTNMNEIHAAAERIWANYEEYVRDVKRYYSNALDFSHNFEQLRLRL